MKRTVAINCGYIGTNDYDIEPGDREFMIRVRYFTVLSIVAFSALTLLVGRQEGHPACKKLSGGVLAWLSVWSKVQTCI